ncbi:MAG: class I SAM-dependent methyltransferase [Candidatus Thermoplasmatota archaeon]|nr:class I SAM-dependent methyltransferase [Candidatus Thermoplasmatota archaeon]MBS3789957.1 class I SAM-dependent methyltransferase [Candidatus Thermoplasmatota archaeon]
MEEIESPYLDGKHYDAMHQMEEDIEFYQKCIEQYGDPTLELACGTGRLTIQLAEEGVDIIGLDLSESMLKRARKKAVKKGVDIDLIEGDMRDFSLDRTFNTILLPFNSILRLTELEEYESLFSNIHKHLSQEGRFIFEIFNPDLEILIDALEETSDEEAEVIEYDDPYGNGKVRVTEKTDYDPTTHILHMDWYYYINGELEVVKNWNLRILFPKEIDAMLKYNGFELEKKYGSFDRSEFSKDSDTQIIICKKKGECF